MENAPLGKLETVALESVWPHEASNFTPWLGQLENIRILGDTLGMELELDDQEVAVGPFAADIVCKNTADSSWVLIENQIKKTDHTHLGQILTYASGLDAKTMVWIAAKFTEEHRAALDWLNENTGESISFFGLEIELWKIGDSAPAPKFNVVSKPNDWSKAVKVQAEGTEGHVSDHKKLQFEFWTAFKSYLEENTKLKSQNPSYRHWFTISIGKSGFHMAAITSSWNTLTNDAKPEVRVDLNLNSREAKHHFAELEKLKTELQTAIDSPLTWHNLADKSCKIYVRRDGDFTDRTKWNELFTWLAKYLNRFNEVFGPVVKKM
jgi:hypothetical protein